MKTCLIVDDSSVIRKVARRILEGLEFHITENSLGDLRFHTVAPHKPDASALRIVYFHGGAYVNEMVAAHWQIIAGLVRRTGATVDVPHYPLAPRHSWADAFPLVKRLALNRLATSQGGRMVFVGDSAATIKVHQLCNVFVVNTVFLKLCVLWRNPRNQE